ncbi:MAG: aldose epimerase family protein [Coraliomargarita sp.]
MSITSKPFGSLPSGESATLFTLSNSNGLSAQITNYGGIIVALNTPDRFGEIADIVLGKNDLQGYLDGHPYFGCLTGRVAGRIGRGKFTVDGTNYQLEVNNGDNALHGGLVGYDKRLWDAEIVEIDGAEKLKLSIVDLDGSNGFPGTVHCTVTYALLENDSLEVTYQANTDTTTPLNLTNHSYFNLAGEGNGNVLGHSLQIISDTVATIDDGATLLGRRDAVQAGFNDYREPVTLGDRELTIHNADIHFFANDGRTAEPTLVAIAKEPKSGRVMEVLTTEPGVQFYAGLFLSCDGPELGKNGSPYQPSGGFCLETQDYADSINFPDMGEAVLKPDTVFTSTTIYRFSTEA